MEELDGGSWVFRARFSSMAFPRLDTVKLSENLLSTEQRWNLYKFCLDLKLKNSTSLSETTSFTTGSNASSSSSSSSSPATSSNDLDQKLKNLDIDSSESKPTTSRKTDHDTRKSNLFLNKNERRSKGGNRRSVSPLGSTELSDTFKEESRSHGKRFFLLPLRRHRSQNKSVSKDDLVRATSPSSMEKLKDKKENNSWSSCFYKLK
ncbi:vitellogenin-A2-like [Dioscorea cayenensis subsp. rotundata]|uniref:Vitellogenin-A2-like n=1 Tax=Dioscorea cayennensis subsp. rotundata TaxID=55577 RepID=A0AB40ANA3_DIOCR|nr:vitellogenin-A2-like [Dioscorea cayenensis subsp. rotundata]